MKKNILHFLQVHKSILFLAAALLFGVGFTVAVNPSLVNAQQSCALANPTFRPHGLQTFVGTTPWYTDANPPDIAFSVDALGCDAGTTIKIEIMGKGSTGNSGAVVDELSLTVPSGGGSAVIRHTFQAGESQCNTANPTPDCIIWMRGFVDGVQQFTTYRSTDGPITSSNSRINVLGYDCDGNCSQAHDWRRVRTVNWVPDDEWDGGGGNPADTIDFAKLKNPIAYDSIPAVIKQIVSIVFIIGIPLVALAIIYAGFLLVTAGGSQEKIKKGKQALLAAVIGGAILLGAWVIAEAIQGTVDQIRGV